MQQPPPFTTQIEKHTLDRMKAAGVQVEAVIENVLAQRCDSLAGWWTLLIEKEMRKERRRQKRQSNSRRVSGASMLAVATAELLKPPRSDADGSEWGLNPKASSASCKCPVSN